MIVRKEIQVGSETLILETGKMAKQADAAVTVRYGETVVLVTATAARKPREGMTFLPLTVDYRENTYAAGKIPVAEACLPEAQQPDALHRDHRPSGDPQVAGETGETETERY